MTWRPEPCSPETLAFMLESAGTPIPAEDVATWSAEDNVLGQEWAGAMMLANKWGYPDIPPIPDVVLPYMEVIDL